MCGTLPSKVHCLALVGPADLEVLGDLREVEPGSACPTRSRSASCSSSGSVELRPVRDRLARGALLREQARGVGESARRTRWVASASGVLRARDRDPEGAPIRCRERRPGSAAGRPCRWPNGPSSHALGIGSPARRSGGRAPNGGRSGPARCRRRRGGAVRSRRSPCRSGCRVSPGNKPRVAEGEPAACERGRCRPRCPRAFGTVPPKPHGYCVYQLGVGVDHHVDALAVLSSGWSAPPEQRAAPAVGRDIGARAGRRRRSTAGRSARSPRRS